MPINDGRCCNSCNSIVLSARLLQMKVEEIGKEVAQEYIDEQEEKKAKEKSDTPDIDSIAERNHENRNT